MLAALLARLGEVTGRADGAIRSAHRLAALPLPELPPDEVVRLDSLLAALDERRDVARRELALLDELDRIATTGLAVGRLTISTEPAPPPDTTPHHR